MSQQTFIDTIQNVCIILGGIAALMHSRGGKK
jgi:hypothetical protein